MRTEGSAKIDVDAIGGSTRKSSGEMTQTRRNSSPPLFVRPHNFEPFPNRLLINHQGHHGRILNSIRNIWTARSTSTLSQSCSPAGPNGRTFAASYYSPVDPLRSFALATIPFRPSNMAERSSSVTLDDGGIRKKKMRKGTHSCFECEWHCCSPIPAPLSPYAQSSAELAFATSLCPLLIHLDISVVKPPVISSTLTCLS
jgi:hypothetical protein